jgi:predicted PurR-regulated permease PerM
LSLSQINTLIESKKADGLSAVGSTLGGTILSLSSVLVVLFLVPVYIFLFLFYKPLLLNFVEQVFDEENSDKIKEVLESTKNLIQSYFVGLLI